MRLEPVSVLPILRELWQMPRDMTRFHAYLEKVTGNGEIFAPLIAANPMARPHMVAFVDTLDALGADAILADACADAERRLARCELARKVSLVPIDDVGGAWSEKTLVDFGARFGDEKIHKRASSRKYPFVTAVAYVSEPPTKTLLRERVLAALYRAAWADAHGPPLTLRAMLEQEGNALRFAGAAGPIVPDVEAVRGALAPHLDATLHATRFAAMYGDAAAQRAGHKPLGVPDDAGFALALHDAKRAKSKPEENL